jgi:hypothetical protein
MTSTGNANGGSGQRKFKPSTNKGKTILAQSRFDFVDAEFLAGANSGMVWSFITLNDSLA